MELKNEAFFATTVRKAFSQRRKTLLNNLKGMKPSEEDREISSALETSGIDGRRRAETLSVLEFGRLSNALLGFIPQRPENY